MYEGSWERLVGTELAFPNAAHVHKKTAGLLSPTEENETTNAGQSKGSSTANDPNIQIQEEDVGLPDSTNTSRDHTGDKEEVQSEKIYRIKERIVLSNVRPM